MSALLDRVTDELERAKAANQRLLKRAKESAERFELSTWSFAGGLAPSLLRGMLGDAQTGELKVPRTDVDADVALASIAALAGVSGALDEMSEKAAIFGGAMAGASLGRVVEPRLLERRREKAA